MSLAIYMRSRQRLIWIGVLTASLTLPIGCRKPEIRVYDVPKDASAAARPLAQPATPNPLVPPVAWTPAPAWQELEPTQFRKGNYLFTEQEDSVEITVTSFPGSTGGMLANVNRWLRQAALPEITEAELADLVVESQLTPSIQAYTVDLKASEATPDSSRIFAAVVPFQGQSWFFKMSGPFAAVESQIPAFQTMVNGLSFGNAAEQASASPKAESDQQLAFRTPEGWTQSQGSSMRIASLSIEKEGLPPADFSIIAFPGDTGGVAANVNRWRRQIGLSDWTAEEVIAAAKTLETEAGLDFLIFDLKSETDGEQTVGDERILAAILEYSGKSWFFKLRGDALLLDTQQNKFRGLLQSVHFDHEGHSH
ncbi:hypothetical protein VDG1235_1266 [Verrucomicrobiia bacterium DG1235]|nr:hypothetical protein VDG1235_1266 [Verrucomicrobiae bacterium DG1235]